jgi:ribosomal protein L29
MKAKELRLKSKTELKIILTDKESNARNLRFDIHTKQEKNHRDYRNIKKDIARIKTILNEDK